MELLLKVSGTSNAKLEIVQVAITGIIVEPFVNIQYVETAPADQLIPMPSRRSPAPCPDDSINKEQDYFGPLNVSSIPTYDPYGTLTGSKISPPSRNNSIPRKPLPYRRQQNASSETILRHGNVLEPAPNEAAASSAPPPLLDIKSAQVNNTVDKGHIPSALSIPTPPSQQRGHFLGRIVRLTDPGGSPTRKATVISSPSVSMSQVLILPRFFQNLKGLIHGEQTKILYRPLQACLGNRARMITSSSLRLKEAL